MTRDLRLILPSALRYGVMCWIGAWIGLANRLLRPPADLTERGEHTTI